MYRIPQGACTKRFGNNPLARTTWYSRTLPLGWFPPEQVTIIPDQAQLWDKAPPDAVHRPKVWRERPPFLHENAIWDCERQTAYAR